MTVQEIVEQIEQLSLREQLALLETLSQSIRKSLSGAEPVGVRGMLATDTPAPSDLEVERSYRDYIEEKYR